VKNGRAIKRFDIEKKGALPEGKRIYYYACDERNFATLDLPPSSDVLLLDTVYGLALPFVILSETDTTGRHPGRVYAIFRSVFVFNGKWYGIFDH